MIVPPPDRSPLIPIRQSLVDSTTRALQANLESGRWTDWLPGERDLCEEFQISRPTLRQALKVLERDGRIRVEQGRRRKIVGCATVSIPPARRNIIGILSPSTMQALPPFVLFWIDVVRSHLAKMGYQLEFHTSRATGTHNPNRALENMVHSSPVAVWILILLPPHVQQWFRNRNLPCLVAGSSAQEISLPSVDIDYRAACRHAAGTFRRRGHEQLALVIPASGLAGDSESETGFCEAVVGEDRPLILRHDGTREDIMRLLERSLRLTKPATGYLVARSAHALTVLTFLMQQGLRLPSQAAVISRDDDAFLEFLTPRMARYSSSAMTFARRVTETVLGIAGSGKAPSKPIRLMPRFVPGETV